MTMRLGRSRSPMRSGVKRGWTDMTALRTRDQAVTTILPICSPASMKRWASAIRRRQGLGEHAGHQPARHSGGGDCVPFPAAEPESGGEGERVDLGGGRIIKKKKKRSRRAA